MSADESKPEEKPRRRRRRRTGQLPIRIDENLAARIRHVEAFAAQAAIHFAKAELKIREIERDLDAGAELEDGPLTFDRSLRMVVPNPNWKSQLAEEEAKRCY